MKKFLLLICALLTGVSGAWAQTYYFATAPTKVSSITSGKYYAIDGLNQQNDGTAGHFLFDNGTKVASANPQALPTDYTAGKFIWKIVGNSTDGWTLQNLETGNYMSLGSSDGSQISTSAASQTNGIYFNGEYATILNSNGQAVDIGNQGNNPTTWSGNTTPDGSRRLVIYEVEVVEIADGACYTMDFVSKKDGNKTWGLKAGTTQQSPVANGTGDVFVAHSYTNTAGNKRWIFVNNTDGTYLAYHGDATSAFDLTNAISEWDIATLTAGSSNVSSDALVVGKICITNDKRYTNKTDKGCYIVNESDGTYDNSSAPFYNGSYTSALKFTATGDAVSSAASLAIAKFDALHELKGYNYLSYAGNITALFASSTDAVTNINAASTTSGVTTAKDNFMKSPEGKKFYAVASTATGQYLSIGESNVSAKSTVLSQDVVMEVEYAGNGKYYLKGVKSAKYAGAPANPPSTYSSSNDATAFYIGNYENTTDNKVYFAKTRTNATDEALHYHIDYTTYVTNWQYSSNPSQWIITAISDDDYTALGEAVDQTISYTLTDMNGATYSGTFTGKIYASLSKGDQPTLTGCDRYSLSNEVWDDENNTYTANITFPFPVSSNDVHNYTYISSFTGDNLYWISDGTKVKSVKVASTGYPTNADYQKYEWEIIPIFSSDAFTFKIKNRKTATYIYSPGTPGANNLELTAEGTALTYSSNRGGSWKINSTLYISRHNSTDNTMELGSWTDHGGVRCTFVERTDFETLIASFTATATAFMPYDGKVGDGLNQYSGENATAMQEAFTEAKDETNSYTAEQIIEKTTLLESPASKLSINLPATGKFYRIKGYSSNYITSNNVGSNASMNGTASANNIVLYSANGNLIFFGSGYGLTLTHTVANTSQPLNAYTFSQGAQIGKYYLKSNAKTANNSNDYGEYCYDNTANGTKLDRNGNPVTSGSYQTDWTLEEVTTLPVTLNGNGFATFASPTAVDFSSASGYTAWQITGIDGDNKITFAQVTGAVAAGAGLLLMGENDAAIEVATAESGDDISGTNKLTGFTQATAIAADTYYGLSGNSFVKVSAGDLRGFKALLSKDYVNESAGAKAFTFVFEGADGITETRTVSGEDAKAIFDLGGRQMAQPRKGINIINGKKVLVK